MGAKTANTQRHLRPRTAWVEVTPDLDRDLAALLRGSGGPAERLVHSLACSADPADGKAAQTVRYLPAEAAAVAADLAALLGRAREAGHPAAGKLADVAAQLGHREPEPAPGAPPVSAPAAPTLSK